MLVRISALVAVLATALTAAPRHTQAADPDATVLRTASTRLGTESPPKVIRWLRGQDSVLSAGIGRDEQTVQIRFRDGATTDILPRMAQLTRLPLTPTRFRPRPLANPAAGPGGTALVLEPFAAELGLPPNAGGPEVSALQSAGFQVSQAYDTNVTVGTMSTLSRYNVIYMHTHTGVDPSGRGILATGEPASGDPTVQPLLQDGSVVVVGVAGSNQSYYAITSQFISLHEGQFASNSLLFLNGCALLTSPEFWQALSARGAGVMLSWDNLSRALDDYLTAAAFFNVMAQGGSVSAAISTLLAANYGTSIYNGQKGTLGFRGNGSITLAAAANSTPPAPRPTATPIPTSRPAPAPTSTSTPIVLEPTAPPPPATATPEPPTTTATSVPPTSTATATQAPPATPADLSIDASVAPGATQRINLHHLLPRSEVQVHVRFPNGDRLNSKTLTADNSGYAYFSFIQAASKITRLKVEAGVSADVKSVAGAITLARQYRIAYGAIDVSVQPRNQAIGKRVTVWIHSHIRTPSRITFLVPHARAKVVQVKTGANGWAHTRYRVSGIHAGVKVVVRAQASLHGRLRVTSSSFTVK